MATFSVPRVDRVYSLAYRADAPWMDATFHGGGMPEGGRVDHLPMRRNPVTWEWELATEVEVTEIGTGRRLGAFRRRGTTLHYDWAAEEA